MDINWVIFYKWVLTIFFTTTFVSQSHLLYKCFFGKVGERLTTPILVNLFFWCIESFMGILLFGSMCLFKWSDLPRKSFFDSLTRNFSACSFVFGFTFLPDQLIYRIRFTFSCFFATRSYLYFDFSVKTSQI